MSPLRTILVGVDLSDASAAALREGARLAEQHGASLHVIHVVERLVLGYLANVLGRTTNELQRTASARAREMFWPSAELGDVPEDTRVDVLFGDAGERLVAAATELEADLLVLGTFGAGGPGRGAGTFTTWCLRRSPCSVLLVDPERQPGPYQSIVAATDLSAAGSLAVPEAVELAVRDRASLSVLHVFQGPWYQVGRILFDDEPSPEFKAEYEAFLKAEVIGLLEEHRPRLGGVHTRVDTVEARKSGSAIAQYVGEHEADLLVMGAHKAGKLRYAVLGSTKERVLRELTLSLLSVRVR
ncbi:MAG: universal stress protein [Proteobacteria bacterium]|nr:universal stress protein [Pseudomonadota bacterium]